ncbi:MAG: hypothetical protein JWP30_1077 [Homoserinimonas sp.]|nr:hypothetical protein [Homoserinimonas sp.]
MLAATYPLVDASEIIRLVGEASFSRGRSYARTDAVAEVTWDAYSSRLTGIVHGTGASPYRCRVDLVPTRKGFSLPTSSYCTCPVGSDCKHVAATILASNAKHVMSPQPSTAPVAAGVSQVQPAWQSTVGALLSVGATSEVTHTTQMGLQFELRERMPRTRERWRGPTAKTATSVGEGEHRLGVRPVIRNDRGNWVRNNLTWSNITYQAARLNLAADQHRWFCQFLALHRATREVYYGQEADWVYLDDFQSPLLWQLLAEAGDLRIALVGSKKEVTVSVAAQAALVLDMSREANLPGTDVRLCAQLTIGGHPHPPEQAGAIGTHGVYGFQLSPRTAFVLAPTGKVLGNEQLRLLGQPETVVIPAADTDEFFAQYYPRLVRCIQVTSMDASVALPEIVSPLLVLTATFTPNHTLHLGWEWEQPQRRKPFHSRENNTDYENEILDSTSRLCPIEERTLQGVAAAEFTENQLPLIEGIAGVRVDVVGKKPPYRELTEAPQLRFTTVETDQRDWFDLGVIVHIEGRDIPFGPLFTALSKGKDKLLLVDGTYLSLNQPAFEQLHALIEEARTLAEWDTGLRISRYQASLWADFEDLAEETAQAQSWRAAVTGLLALDTVEPARVPASVQADVRPYQADGFAWLAFLYEHQLGGILADDMGLGKTLQALALIAHASASRPFLVVAPTSVVPNWISEAARFVPTLTVTGITETQKKGRMPLAEVIVGADIVVTSYALFRLDFDAYQGREWAGLVLDEAQFVKNRTSRAYTCAKELNTPFKLAITGTPMENNLLDLWSLFSIVAPGLFPSARKFTEDYVRPIDRDPSSELLIKLRRRIRPLMMRRTKELVAADLPAKQEQVLRIALDPRHQKIYDTYLQRERQKLLGLIEDMDRNRFIVFRSLTLLRMLSLDASLVDDTHAGVPSSKLDALCNQLEDVVAEGHRALIFSQFTTYLKKAAVRLDEQGIAYSYLDGTTLNRGDVISGFTNGTAPVFLISLKAGGFGLNLTEADYVFLLDPWWNPASEAQAVDRTHRIGQNKNVMVYRMVATGTIEEKVMALKERKAKLFSSVMDDDAVFSSALTADDIRGLFEN